jgi:hypothetical protein
MAAVIFPLSAILWAVFAGYQIFTQNRISRAQRSTK